MSSLEKETLIEIDEALKTKPSRLVLGNSKKPGKSRLAQMCVPLTALNTGFLPGFLPAAPKPLGDN